MIQIDMEMPKNCNLCPLQVLDADGHHTCTPDTKSRDVDIEIINGTKAAFCPLLNVPRKRGAEWIPVEERMPEERDTMFAKLKGTDKWRPGMFEKMSDDVRVVILHPDGKRRVHHSYTVNGEWACETLPPYGRKVTHWCENPTLPEEEGKP